MIRNRLLFGFVKVAGALAVLVAASAGGASAAGDATCSGGSIAPGVYSSLKIAGACRVDSGSVTVEHDLTVLPGASLAAITGGIGAAFFTPAASSSDLTVGGNLDVQAGAVMTLGCEPFNYPCLNDPAFPVGPGAYSTHHVVAGNLTAENALGVVIHHTAVGGNLSLNGGGGGVASCGSFVPVLGAPPYGDVEDIAIGGNLTITGWQTCWLGWFRVIVLGNVTFSQNATGDPDGNEMANNTVMGNLDCSGDNPHPQLGDSTGGPSTVLGHANDQCSASSGLVVP